MRVAKAARLEVANSDNVVSVPSKEHTNSNKNHQHTIMQDNLSEMESLRSICAVVGARANFFSPGHLERVLASWPKEEDSTSYKTVADAINVFSVPLEQYWNNSQSDNNDREVDSSDESENVGPYSDNDHRKKDEQGSNTDNVIASTSRTALQNVAGNCQNNSLEQENRELQEQQQEEQLNEYRNKSNLLTNENKVESISGDKSLGHKKLHYRIPHARFLSETFYPSRVDAMLSRGYHAYNFSTNIDNNDNHSNNSYNFSSRHINTKNYSESNITNTNRNKQGNDLIIAIDRKFGNGGKLFNIFTRSSALHQHETSNRQQLQTYKYKENQGQVHKAQNKIVDKEQECILSHDNNKYICWTNSLAKFINAIPNAYERNLYVVIDESAPVDPYFDIDCHLPLSPANRPLSSSLNDDESIIALFCQEVLSEWFQVNLDNNDGVDDDNDTDNFMNGDNENDKSESNMTNQKRIVMDSNEDNDVEKEDCTKDASYARTLMWKVEELLHIILHYLRDIFEKSLRVKLKECLVLTSSVAVCKRANIITTKSNEGNNKSNVFVNGNESTSTNRTTQPKSNNDPENSSSNVTNEHHMNDKELIDMKISFHVHFRFANNEVFSNVQELHRFMMKVRAQLDESILLYCHKLESANVNEVDDNADDDDDDQMQCKAEVAALVRTCVDFGVYTRWRAFRLPYNVKCPLQTCNTFTPSSWSSESSYCSSSCFYSSTNANFTNRNAQTLNLFSVEAAEQELYNCTGLTPPSHSIGASAPYCLSCIVLPTEVPVHNEEPESKYTPFSCNNSTLLDEQLETLRKAMYCFLFLLPLDPETSTFTNKKLRVFLETYTIKQELCQEKNSPSTIYNTETNVNDKNSTSNLSTLKEEKNMLAFVDAVFDMACIQRERANTNDENNKKELHRIRIPKRLAPILESNHRKKQLIEEEQTQNEQLLEEQQEHEQLLEMQQIQNTLSDEEQEQLQLESNGARQKSSVGRSPFSLERPPLPHSSRVLVYDRQIRSLVAEVFMCLSPLYGYHGQYQEEMEHAITQFNKSERSNNTTNKSVVKVMHTEHNSAFNDFDSVHLESISPERLTVQYEEAIRAYYVYQKQSRYCLQLNRLHRATYGQLYLTYGSIKVRCYSNDCCARCLIVPWSDPDKKCTESEKNMTSKDKSDIDDAHENDTMQHDDNVNNTTEIDNTHVVNCQNEHFSSGVNSFVSPIHGYPKYDRLTAIRNALFPPLPADELLKRYGMSTLRAVEEYLYRKKKQN